MTKTYTIETLARAVAFDLDREAGYGGFNDFEEMVKGFRWTPEDIKNNIRGNTMFLLKREYKELCSQYGSWQDIPEEVSQNLIGTYMDGGLEQGGRKIKYDTFKALVLSHLI